MLLGCNHRTRASRSGITTLRSIAGRSTRSTRRTTSSTSRRLCDHAAGAGAPLRGRARRMSDDRKYTVESASRAAERDELAEWIADFLASPGSDNPVLAVKLTDPPRSWLGPMQLPIDQLQRLA